MGTVISCTNTAVRYHVKYVQYTGLDVRNSRNSLKKAGYLYVYMFCKSLTVQNTFQPLPGLIMQLCLGGLGMAPQ